jgi:hypothetical protein
VTRDFTMKTPAELAEQREARSIWAENRDRDRAWARLVADNAAIGVFMHPDRPDDPWSEVHFTPCPPGCRKHGGDAA